MKRLLTGFLMLILLAAAAVAPLQSAFASEVPEIPGPATAGFPAGPSDRQAPGNDTAGSDGILSIPLPWESSGGSAAESGDSAQDPARPEAGPGRSWPEAYRQFILSGQHHAQLSPQFLERLREAGDSGDSISFLFALHDIDRDSVPELIVVAKSLFEQADIYSCSGESVAPLGSMGGDSFFQEFFYFPESKTPGLFATLGGPVMSVERCVITDGVFQNQVIGSTLVGSEGDETAGLELSVDDSAMYDLLYSCLVSGQNHETAIQLYAESDFLPALQSGMLQPGGIPASGAPGHSDL